MLAEGVAAPGAAGVGEPPAGAAVPATGVPPGVPPAGWVSAGAAVAFGGVAGVTVPAPVCEPAGCGVAPPNAHVTCKSLVTVCVPASMGTAAACGATAIAGERNGRGVWLDSRTAATRRQGWRRPALPVVAPSPRHLSRPPHGHAPAPGPGSSR